MIPSPILNEKSHKRYLKENLKTQKLALPNGWNIEKNWFQPLFHSTQLTKLDGSAYYAAFFTFYAQSEENQKFEPNALILIARHYHIKQLKSALMLLYDKHVIGKLFARI